MMNCCSVMIKWAQKRRTQAINERFLALLEEMSERDKKNANCNFCLNHDVFDKKERQLDKFSRCYKIKKKEIIAN